MPIVVFDMDDTLYVETTYVQSGFQAVCTWLTEAFGIDSRDALRVMNAVLHAEGRGKVFDRVLTEYGLFNRTNVRKCLTAYRLHQPQIVLDEATLPCFERLRVEFPLYLVTDGNKVVQANKVEALGLDEWMRFCYITHRYGRYHSKPSPYVFHKICAREQVAPQDVIYVGDNPHKDFIGIKKEGFRTVRIMRGAFKDVELREEYEADIRIDSLDELTVPFIEQLTGRGNM